jgi:peroxiredoxin
MSIETGEQAPDFTLQNTEGEKLSLSVFQGEKNVVLLFFPLAFTGTCTNEMCTMRDNMKMYNSLNAKVIGISVDSFFTLEKFKKSENLNFTLLSDFNKSVSEEYGVLYDEFFGMKGVSKRAAFVIDREGMIIYAEVLEDAGKLPDFDAVREALKG